MLLTKTNTFIIGPIATLLGYFMNGIFWVLSKIGLPNIGLAIIIMTIIIYMALMPLTVRQQKFSKLSQKMQPELNRIQKKYAGRNDTASMQKMQEETKAVYKKYGVSPTGSCVQLLIQMPILFALYRVFYNVPAYVPMVKTAFTSVVNSLYKADATGAYLAATSAGKNFARQFSNDKFTGGDVTYIKNTFIDVLNKFSTTEWADLAKKFPDLSSVINKTVHTLERYNNFLGLNIGNSPRTTLHMGISNGSVFLVIGAILVPVLAALTQWINVKLMPTSNSNTGNEQADQMAQSMKTMNIMMPLMSAFFCYTLPSGLGLYWIAGAVIRSIQQIFVNKHIDKIDVDAMVEANEEKIEEKAERKIDKTKKVSDSNVANYSRINTKNIQKKSKYSTTLSAEDEAKVNKTIESRKGKKYKKGSLAAKANMVQDFNNAGKSDDK